MKIRVYGSLWSYDGALKDDIPHGKGVFVDVLNEYDFSYQIRDWFIVFDDIIYRKGNVH